MVNGESIMWCALMYYPSQEMPKKTMSEYKYLYTYQDLLIAVLDKLADLLRTIKIQQCSRCGFSVIDLHKHSEQYHRELFNSDGSRKENAVTELQKTGSNGHSSAPQELSDKPDDRRNKDTQIIEHSRATEPA